MLQGNKNASLYLLAGKSEKNPSSSSASVPFVNVPDENPDYIACQHCGRKFNEDAAKRHIPFCQQSKQKTIHKAPPALKADFVNKRISYKPPPPKTKRQ